MLKDRLTIHEDELPKDLPEYVYKFWLKNSYVDGVRMGPYLEKTDNGTWVYATLTEIYENNNV